MNDEIMLNARKFYKLKNLIRYNNSMRIKDESVLEHTAMVSLVVLDLFRIYKFDRLKALKMALVHDLPECETSDIPFNVKARFPKIKDAVNDAELDVCSDFSWNISGILSLLDEDCVESTILKLADVINCEVYAANEVSLGNSTMKKILQESRERISILTDELKEFER